MKKVKILRIFPFYMLFLSPFLPLDVLVNPKHSDEYLRTPRIIRLTGQRTTILHLNATAPMRFFTNHSLRSAATGSLFAALREGIKPPIRVRIMLSTIRSTAASGGRMALMSFLSARECIMTFAGIIRR